MGSPISISSVDQPSVGQNHRAQTVILEKAQKKAGEVAGGLSSLDAEGAVQLMQRVESKVQTVIRSDTGIDYQLLSLLGSGGMADVYSAHKTTSPGELVALKIPNGKSIGDEELRRFQREVDVLKGVKHKYLVPIYDSGDYKGTPFYVMKQVNGVSMKKALANGSLHQGQALLMLADAAKAVHALHQAGVVHRDLKPENILVDEQKTINSVVAAHPQVFVADAGLAGFSGSDQGVTRSGVIMGTPMYMSPEQTRDVSSVDHRSDLFSIGVIAYSIIAGGSPFTGSTAVNTIYNINAVGKYRGNLQARRFGREVAALQPLFDELFHAEPSQRVGQDGKARFDNAERIATFLEQVVRENPTLLYNAPVRLDSAGASRSLTTLPHSMPQVNVTPELLALLGKPA